MRAMAAKQPENPLARFGFANELLKAGLLDEAVVELAAYLERYDDEGNGWLRYADALRSLGRDADAWQAIEKGKDAARRYGHGALTSEMDARLEEWA